MPVMSWERKFQEFIVFTLLSVGFYAISGPILRSTSPGGTLGWSGRRWRLGFTFTVILFLLGFEIWSFGKFFSFWTMGFFWILLGFLILLGIRWLLWDIHKENQAREKLFQEMGQTEVTLTVPRRSRAQEIWNWVLIAYGAAGLLGGIYEIAQHVLAKFHAGSR